MKYIVLLFRYLISFFLKIKKNYQKKKRFFKYHDKRCITEIIEELKDTKHIGVAIDTLLRA